MQQSINRFKNDTKGSVALMAAVSLGSVVVAGGLALDYSRALNMRLELQNAADAAALGAAASTNATDVQRVALAQSLFKSNATKEAAAATTSVAVANSEVTVEAALDVPTTLMQIIGVDHVPINVTATAASNKSQQSPFCILLLEPVETGLYVNSGSNLDADCKIQVNSLHSNAIVLNSSSSVVSAALNVAGSTYMNSGGTATPAPIVGAETMADPLATLPEPVEASMPCTHNNYVVNQASATINPGVYCGSTTINANSTVVMNPGVYVFQEGEFVINANSAVTGQNVLLVFKGLNARLNVNANSTLNLTGRQAGALAGLVMFQSRDPETLSTPPHIINSYGLSKLEGTIYVPNGVLEVNSWSTTNQSASYTAIIARKMVLNSAGTFTVRSKHETGTPFPADLNEFRNTFGARLVN